MRVGLNRGGGVHAWPIAEMVGLLRGRGFEVAVRQAGRGMWSANAMIAARKPSLC